MCAGVELFPYDHVLVDHLLHRSADGCKAPPDELRKQEAHYAYQEHRRAKFPGGDGGEDNAMVEEEDPEIA